MHPRLTSRTLLGHPVPPIAIGCAPLGNMPETFDYEVPEDSALSTIRAALDSSLPWLDTAAKYGDGESERRIGTVLKERGGLPPQAMLDTKIGADPGGDYRADTVRRRLERSLDLLGLDRLELVFLHDPEVSTFEEITAAGGPLDALCDYRDQGVIGHLGVAGGPIDLMTRYVETGIFEAAITHNRYTLLERSADPLLTLCHERGIPILNAAPYGSGILAKGPATYPRYEYGRASDATLQMAFAVESICNRHNIPLAAAALQFSLRDPRITATIVGMSRPERIDETITLASIDIPDDCWQEIDDATHGRRQR
ncbi:MAG TPA: aldo/keto reductase [Thermomicrobiales bacterium]|nr:aldo/keto reductase [Thermomicrobiales bacterium]